MLLDLVPVDLRFLSSENFVSPRRNQVTASAADKAIMQDKDPGYRVLNLTVSPFNDATTSYFHRSVGGYHGAKLARYQDLIDRYLSNADDGVLDMLNTRYLIVPGKEGQPEAQRRTTAFGAAWFVDSVIYAPSAQAEIDLLGKTDLRTTAVVSGQNPVLGDFLRPGLEGLCRRRGKPLLPGRLRPAGDDAARRHAHRRMAVPRTGLDGRRRRDARGVARDPAGSRRGAGLLF